MRWVIEAEQPDAVVDAQGNQRTGFSHGARLSIPSREQYSANEP
jgi:hypothetical protein